MDSEQELSLLRLKLEHVQREKVALERKVGWLKEDVFFWKSESRFWEKEYYGLADERGGV